MTSPSLSFVTGAIWASGLGHTFMMALAIIPAAVALVLVLVTPDHPCDSRAPQYLCSRH